MTSFAQAAYLPVALALLLPVDAPLHAEDMVVGAGMPSSTSRDIAATGKVKHRHHRDFDAATARHAASGAGTDNPRSGERQAERRQLKTSGPIVLGDSIGIGLSMASGAPRLAHEGVAIRSSAALAQLRRVPDRSVVVVSLGTNDAVGSIKGVEGAIDRIVAVADRNDLRVVWLGPPCVFKSWNDTAERLDAVLKRRLGDSSRIRYVSAADTQVCDRGLRAGDGVHFTMQGYAMLWKRVVAAEGEWASRPAQKLAAATAPGSARTASDDRPGAEAEGSR